MREQQVRESTCFAALVDFFVVNASYLKALDRIDPSLHSPLATFPSLCSQHPFPFYVFNLSDKQGARFMLWIDRRASARQRERPGGVGALLLPCIRFLHFLSFHRLASDSTF